MADLAGIGHLSSVKLLLQTHSQGMIDILLTAYGSLKPWTAMLSFSFSDEKKTKAGFLFLIAMYTLNPLKFLAIFALNGQTSPTQSKSKAILESFGVEAWSDGKFESLQQWTMCLYGCKTCCGLTILLECTNWTLLLKLYLFLDYCEASQVSIIIFLYLRVV